MLFIFLTIELAALARNQLIAYSLQLKAYYKNDQQQQ